MTSYTENLKLPHEDETLGQLAVPYAVTMAQNAVDYPQATIAEHFGEADYLRVLTEESDATPEKGQPTDKLVDATVRSIPGMVTVNFTIYERPMASPTASTRSRVQAPKGVCC